MTIRRRTAVCNPLTNDRAVVRVPMEDNMPIEHRALLALLDIAKDQGFIMTEVAGNRLRVDDPKHELPPIYIPHKTTNANKIASFAKQLQRRGLVIEPSKVNDYIGSGKPVAASHELMEEITTLGAESVEFIATLPRGLEVLDLLTGPVEGAAEHEVEMANIVGQHLLFSVVGLSQVAHLAFAEGKKAGIAAQPADMNPRAQVELEEAAKNLQAAHKEFERLEKERDKARAEKDEIAQLLRDERKKIKDLEASLAKEREDHTLLKSALSIFKQAL